MYELNFTNPITIKLGSKYNSAEIALCGDYVPDLTGLCFQDKGCISNLKDEVVLVQWSVIDDELGFVVWLISEKDMGVRQTERFIGCCEAITFNEDNNLEVTVTQASGEVNRITLER